MFDRKGGLVPLFFMRNCGVRLTADVPQNTGLIISAPTGRCRKRYPTAVRTPNNKKNGRRSSRFSLFLCRSAAVALSVHRTVLAAMPAGGLPLLFVSNYAVDDPAHQCYESY